MTMADEAIQSGDNTVYCGHRIHQEDCDGCINYRICLHCDEQEIFEDIFGIMWCEEIYFGLIREETITTMCEQNNVQSVNIEAVTTFETAPRPRYHVSANKSLYFGAGFDTVEEAVAEASRLALEGYDIVSVRDNN